MSTGHEAASRGAHATPRRRDDWTWFWVSLLVFPPLFIAGVAAGLLRGGDGAGKSGSLLHDAAVHARSTIAVALSDA